MWNSNYGFCISNTTNCISLCLLNKGLLISTILSESISEIQYQLQSGKHWLEITHCRKNVASPTSLPPCPPSCPKNLCRALLLSSWARDEALVLGRAVHHPHGPQSSWCYATLSGESLFNWQIRLTKFRQCTGDIDSIFQVSYYGNPHSRTHQYGWESEKAMEVAREQVTLYKQTEP